jgi:SRSO17 transposase
MSSEATLGDGALVLNETGFPTQGKASVGVARKYSGTLGKVTNCQLAVTCCGTAPRATWPGECGRSRPRHEPRTPNAAGDPCPTRGVFPD